MVQKGLRTVPAEPIRCALEKWIDEKDRLRASNFSGDGALTGVQEACWLIFGQVRTDGRNPDGERILYRLLDRREGHKKSRVIKKMVAYPGRGNQVRFREIEVEKPGEPHKQQNVGFDLADKILCKLGLQHLWQQDPVLAEAYRKVDLAAVDLLDPTSDVTRQEAEDAIWQAYLKTGSIRGAQRELEVTSTVIGKFIAARLSEAA